VKSFRGAEITVTPLDDLPVRMDIDGESPGVAPATFRVLPAAVKLLGARPECV
jgi:diacylglycerol kinase family enzyme